MAAPTGTKRLRNDRIATLAVVALILGFVSILGALSLVRYAAVRADIDLSIYSQVVWNTAFGEPFRTSVLPFTENYLGNHFTPIMALFVPIYLLWADPRVLLLAQVIAAALAVVPLFWFAREQLPTPWAGVLLSAAFLIYPALQHQTLTDFHGVALGTTAVMWAYFALLSRRDLLLFCLLPVMLLIREDLTLVIVVMGVYAFFVQRRRRLGLILFALGLAASVLVIVVLIPTFRGGRVFHYSDYYDYLGDSPLAMLRTLVAEPGVWLPRALYRPKLQLLVQLLLPVAFLPLLVPTIFLLGASALAYLFLVDYPFWPIYTLGTQYQALLMPFIFYGTVLAIGRLAAWVGSRRGWATVATRSEGTVAATASGVVLALCLVTSILWGPMADEAKRAEFRIDEQSLAERALLAQIPPDAGVVADDRFASYLSNREGFFILGGLYDYAYPIDYMIYEDTPVGFPAHPPALVGAPGAGGWQVPRWELLGSSGLTELRRKDGSLGAIPLAQPPVFEGGVTLRGATGYGEPLAAAPGQPLEVALVWANQGAELDRLVPFLQLIQRQGEAQYRWASVDREPYGGLFPTDQWWPGSVVGDVYVLDLPPWLAPGEYELHAGLYTRDGQQRLALPDGSTTALAGTVVVPAPAALPGAWPPEVPIRLDAPMAEGLVLYGQNPILPQVTSGTTLDVALYWQATGPIPRVYGLRFDLVPEGSSGPAATWQRSLVSEDYPTTAWGPGVVVAAWVPLNLPADLSPGRYDLLVTATASGEPAGQPVRLASLEILE
jgi:uncharacterized membrane protein